MARLFCMMPEALERSERARLRTKIIAKKKEEAKKTSLRSPILRNNKFDTSDADNIRDSPIPMYACEPPNPSPVLRTGLEAHIRDIRCAFRQSEKQTYRQSCAARQNLEWSTLAMVLDRLFFYLYLITIGVALFLIFPLQL